VPPTASATRTAAPDATATSARVVIIGTGFAGIAMATDLKRSGMDDFLILERAQDVGGTWRDNTYPGCACDVPSLLYSFSFAQNAEWSNTFSPQPEIWEYLRSVAKAEQLDAHIRFGHTVTGARWDEARRRWSIETSEGTYDAQILIAGLGPLSEPSTPHLPGIESFEGTVFHSATWDHSHDLHGERVAVIGTGASAIQFVPAIQPDVEHLTVFQRTPPWVMERRSRPVTKVERFLFRHVPGAQLLARASIYWARELAVIGFTRRPKILERASRMAKAHLDAQVADPELRRKLTPDYTLGCKRVLLSNDWYPALTQDNVTLEDHGIAEVRPRSIVTNDGTEHPVDTIIFGTGFQVADIPAAHKMWGVGGVNLGEKWSDSASAYLGSTVDEFPNLFFIIGPNTGLGHSSMVYMIESQVAYIADALRTMDRTGASTVEVRADALESYNVALQEQLAGTVWNTGGCKSWYLDKSGKNTSLWPDFTFVFRRRTHRFDPERYVVTSAAGDPLTVRR
jgi:cation diffusion facilitator CzcD-associated flavoprotein CzcO